MRDKEGNQKDVKIPRVYPLNCESISNINKEKPSNQLRFYNKCWGPPRLQHLFFAIKNALISFFLYNKVTTLNRKGEISAKLY